MCWYSELGGNGAKKANKNKKSNKPELKLKKERLKDLDSKAALEVKGGIKPHAPCGPGTIPENPPI